MERRRVQEECIGKVRGSGEKNGNMLMKMHYSRMLAIIAHCCLYAYFIGVCYCFERVYTITKSLMVGIEYGIAITEQSSYMFILRILLSITTGYLETNAVAMP